MYVAYRMPCFGFTVNHPSEIQCVVFFLFCENCENVFFLFISMCCIFLFSVKIKGKTVTSKNKEGEQIEEASMLFRHENLHANS